MTDNGVADLAERLRYVDFKNWDADEVAERVTLNGSRFLSREAAERQAAIEEGARHFLKAEAQFTATYASADGKVADEAVALLREALERSVR